MTRIGLVGCGAWGRHILRDLKQCGAVVHVVAPSEGSRQNAAANGADSIVNHLSDLPPVDGYIVAAPTGLHAAIIEALLPSGRPIYTEKPLTADVASAQRIVDVGAERVFVMQKWRYHPGIERMRQEIVRGAIGEVLGIHIQRWGWGNPHTDVNAIWILFPHDLSVILHWLGDIPPVRFALPALPGAIGTAVIAQLGRVGEPLITIDMSSSAPEHRRTFTVVGSAGSMELRDSYDTAIRVRRGAPGDPKAAVETIEIPSDMPLLLEVQAFLAHLDGGPPPMTSAREGLLIVERTADIEATVRRNAAT
ncbi:MAG TPA: Gfo/Idh/MocA family oxidoreductase [Dongiaceae bacterium]|nr:Gfo/Idh/MocA family oxidoreductase [Dongiaceae bacterium]